MGVIKRGILGGFTNKVGNIVGTTWKGRAVVKSLPLSVANPRTTPQVNQRTKFGAIAIFASQILSGWIKPLWDRFSGNISGYNDFCRENITVVDSNGFIDFQTVNFSKGKMNLPSMSNLVVDAANDFIRFNFVMPADAVWGQSGQTGYAMLLDVTNQKMVEIKTITANPGSSTQVQFNSSLINTGAEFVVVQAIKRADGTQVSPNWNTDITV